MLISKNITIAENKESYKKERGNVHDLGFKIHYTLRKKPKDILSEMIGNCYLEILYTET